MRVINRRVENRDANLSVFVNVGVPNFGQETKRRCGKGIVSRKTDMRFEVAALITRSRRPKDCDLPVENIWVIHVEYPKTSKINSNFIIKRFHSLIFFCEIMIFPPIRLMKILKLNIYQKIKNKMVTKVSGFNFYLMLDWKTAFNRLKQYKF